MVSFKPLIGFTQQMKNCKNILIGNAHYFNNKKYE